MKNIFRLITLLLLFSCERKDANETVVEGYDRDYCEENAPLSFFVDSIEVVSLAEDSNIHLANVEKIVCHEEDYYILDNNKVMRFGPDGNFLNYCGERGHGHGEYINIATFIAHNDTISIIDSYKNTLMHYALDGDFLCEVNAPEGTLVNVKDATFEKDNVLFLANFIFNEENDTYTRWNILTGEVSVIGNAKVKSSGAKEYVGTHSFCEFCGNIRYVQPFSDVIRSTDGSDIRVRTARKVLSDRELSLIDDFSIMTYASHMDDFTGFNSVFETGKYLLLTFSNLEYFLVDKGTAKCVRYSYEYDEDAESFPLLNILSSTDSLLIGVVNIGEYDSMRSMFQRYGNVPQDMGYGHVVVKYHIKR